MNYLKLIGYENYGKSALHEGFGGLSKKKQGLGLHFANAKKFLANPKFAFENIFPLPFTEFAAFSAQNIHKPWNIDENNWQHRNQGRKLLSSLTKNIHKKYQELDPNFRTSYPDLNQAFLDRITQVRNYRKHPDADRYIQNYNSRYNQLPNPPNDPSTTPHNTNIGMMTTAYGIHNDPIILHPVNNIYNQNDAGYNSSPPGSLKNQYGQDSNPYLPPRGKSP